MTLFGDQLAVDVPTGLGSAMAGGKGRLSSTPREAFDYYPPPPEVTQALIARCGAAMRRCGPLVWEPCARGGAMITVLAAGQFDVIGTDIVADQEHGVTALDVLTATVRLGDVVVTNPPFALAGAIVQHLLGALGVRYLALVLKATFWHAASRAALFQRYPPTQILVLTWRPDFLNRGAPTMDCIWCVWDRTIPVETTEYVLLPRPSGGGDSDLFAGETHAA